MVDWLELVMVKFPFGQNWFYSDFENTIQLFDEMPERKYMASALMGFGCLIKHVKIQRKKGLVGKCNSFILKD